MWNEPWTLQGRHQSLVMNFRLKDVYQNEYGRKNSRERQNPFILPSYICEQSGQQCKEGVPETCLPHCSKRWSSETRPQTADKDAHRYHSQESKFFRP